MNEVGASSSVTSTIHCDLVKELPFDVIKRLHELVDKDNLWERMIKGRLDHPDIKSNLFSVEELKITELYKIAATMNLLEVKDCIKEYDIRRVLDDSTKISFIYNLPEPDRVKLCGILTRLDDWKQLEAIFRDADVGFDAYLPQAIEGPDELLKLLGDRNFTIELLYLALARIDCLWAMSLLEKYVPEDLKIAVRSDKVIDGAHVLSLSANEMKNGAKSDTLTRSSQSLHQPTSEKPLYSPRGESLSEMSYRQLTTATNGWSGNNCLAPKRKCNFFWGELRGQKLAIKRLRVQEKHQCDYDQVLEEIRKLRSAKHKHVLTMLSFIEGDLKLDESPCLIYPFMEKGSLYDILLCDRPLTWKKILSTTFDVAHALQYLHSCFGTAVISKSSDIIFNESMAPLVSDICLPSMLQSQSSEDLALYLPPEGSKWGENLDSFCIGTILLELAVGKPAGHFGKHPQNHFQNVFEQDSIKNISDAKQFVRFKLLVSLCYNINTPPDNPIVNNIGNILKCLGKGIEELQHETACENTL